MDLPPSARELTNDDWELAELARVTIDANTDARRDQDGAHTMGAAVRARRPADVAGVNFVAPGAGGTGTVDALLQQL